MTELSTEVPRVGPDSRLKLHFSLALENGELLDSNFDREPAVLQLGDGTLPEGFEQLLMGLGAGQRASFTVPPQQAFGPHNPANVQRLERHVFAADMALERGLVVSFAVPGQGELPGVVAEIDDAGVSVDFNHPLAGKTLLFEVHIHELDLVAR